MNKILMLVDNQLDFVTGSKKRLICSTKHNK